MWVVTVTILAHAGLNDHTYGVSFGGYEEAVRFHGIRSMSPRHKVELIRVTPYEQLIEREGA